ncbi:hypothetical protein [Cyclobacterium plantarum]|uniref:hypothetical protein n=1 Tax=Cyclobacterium plantarum TaxID=2716263 RepID=UPI003F701C6A
MKINRTFRGFLNVYVLPLPFRMEKSTYKYAKNYCEENVWQLCVHPDIESQENVVLIISNTSRNCPFWFHNPVENENPVCWDYHVVLLARKQEKWWIYDFDSTLEFPCSLDSYLRQTFGKERLSPETAPLFKGLPAKDFASNFFSDRAHMKDAIGNWIFSPPSWPEIEHGHDKRLEIAEIMDFSDSSQYEIIQLDELKGRYL